MSGDDMVQLFRKRDPALALALGAQRVLGDEAVAELPVAPRRAERPDVGSLAAFPA